MCPGQRALILNDFKHDIYKLAPVAQWLSYHNAELKVLGSHIGTEQAYFVGVRPLTCFFLPPQTIFFISLSGTDS